MHPGTRTITCALMGMTAVLVSAGRGWGAPGEFLSIYEIQTTTIDGDASVYGGDVVNCVGGVCVGKFAGYRPRLILQDPDHPDEWGAIQVKDWIFNSSTGKFELYDSIRIGDWVELTNVLVEEFRGGTFLQYQSTHRPGFRIVSRNNALPEPVIVSVADTPAPVWDPYNDEWLVPNHDAEPYESMQLIVRDVRVTAMDLGKAVDNYRLETPAGDACWAADYMNADVGLWGYHSFVRMDQHFCAVAGTLEQYTQIGDGWDYYQLITMRTGDLIICGDADSDEDADLDDLPRFPACLSGPRCDRHAGGCLPPIWAEPPMNRPVKHCLMMDMDYDGDVDLADFAAFQRVFSPE